MERRGCTRAKLFDCNRVGAWLGTVYDYQLSYTTAAFQRSGGSIHGDLAMSTITRRPWSPATDWVPTSLARLTVDQYEAVVDSGVFTKHDRLLLINGYLVTKVTKKPPYTVATELVRDELIGLVPPGRWRVAAEAPVRIPDYNEPEPDVSLVRGKAKYYAKRHPGPADLALVDEVAESSIAEDRRLARVYGPAGIPVYWIVNLIAQQVEVYTVPHESGYLKRRVFTTGQSVPVVIDGVEVGRIAVAEILPPSESNDT
jgi:Uma2 family endonuclease